MFYKIFIFSNNDLDALINSALEEMENTEVLGEFDNNNNTSLSNNPEHSRALLNSNRYRRKMIAASSVHYRKSGIKVGDRVKIKVDFDNNTKTRRKLFKPLYSQTGIVIGINGNNYYEVDVNGQRKHYRSNQLKLDLHSDN